MLAILLFNPELGPEYAGSSEAWWRGRRQRTPAGLVAWHLKELSPSVLSFAALHPLYHLVRSSPGKGIDAGGISAPPRVEPGISSGLISFSNERSPFDDEHINIEAGPEGENKHGEMGAPHPRHLACQCPCCNVEPVGFREVWLCHVLSGNRRNQLAHGFRLVAGCQGKTLTLKPRRSNSRRGFFLHVGCRYRIYTSVFFSSACAARCALPSWKNGQRIACRPLVIQSGCRIRSTWGAMEP